MKTSRQPSPTVAEAALKWATFFGHNQRCGGLAVLLLILSGLQLPIFVPAAFAESSTLGKNGGERQWSLQIDTVGSGDLDPDLLLEAEIRRNLWQELSRTKKFKQVLRGHDRNGNDVPDLLILKTTVQEYAPSSQTRGAVHDDIGLLGVVPGLFLKLCGRAAVGGSTKLKVRFELYTREGHLVLEDVAGLNARSVGDSLQAAQKLARNVAVKLKRSSLPEPATTSFGQETAEVSGGEGDRDRPVDFNYHPKPANR